MNQNPYAAPSAEADGGGPTGGLLTGLGGDLRREGDLIVVPVTGAAFPPRCVVCNERTGTRLKRRLFWHPQGYYALIFIGWLIYVIVAMMVRKRADVEMGLCGKHLARRRNGILIGWLGSIACFVAAVALAGNYPLIAILCGLAFFACVIAGVIMVRVVTPKRIDQQFAWLKFARPFTDSIEY